MRETSLKQELPPDPLSLLADQLASDMEAVNATILKHLESDVPLVEHIARYLIAAGGKRIRPLLTLAATRLFDPATPRPQGLAACVEFIHTATLLHDDVVDESHERRGKPSANDVFGNQASVLVGDFLFSRAFELMVADGSLDVLRILSAASARIAEGEVLQLQTVSQLDTPWERYVDVIQAKTAVLFGAACEIGPVIAGQNQYAPALRAYGDALGCAFQITDDVLDYEGTSARLGKNPGDDFFEGKMTAPVILALQKADADDRAFWNRTLADRDFKDGDFERACAILTRHQSLREARDLAHGYAARAQKALAAIPQDSPYVQALLDLAQFAVTRAA